MLTLPSRKTTNATAKNEKITEASTKRRNEGTGSKTETKTETKTTTTGTSGRQTGSTRTTNKTTITKTSQQPSSETTKQTSTTTKTTTTKTTTKKTTGGDSGTTTKTEEGIFISIGEINELRRSVVDKLMNIRMTSKKDPIINNFNLELPGTDKETGITANVITEEQSDTLNRREILRTYISNNKL